MNINYHIIAGVIFILLILLFWFFRKNKTDEKVFEKDFIQEDLETEKQKKITCKS